LGIPIWMPRCPSCWTVGCSSQRARRLTARWSVLCRSTKAVSTDAVRASASVDGIGEEITLGNAASHTAESADRSAAAALSTTRTGAFPAALRRRRCPVRRTKLSGHPRDTRSGAEPPAGHRVRQASVAVERYGCCERLRRLAHGHPTEPGLGRAASALVRISGASSDPLPPGAAALPLAFGIRAQSAQMGGAGTKGRHIDADQALQAGDVPVAGSRRSAAWTGRAGRRPCSRRPGRRSRAELRWRLAGPRSPARCR
jgi:hypothetical protein